MIKSISILSFFIISTVTYAQTEIYNEDFEAGIPATYTLVDNDGQTPNSAVSEYTEAWISKTDPMNDGNKVASSTSFFEPTGTADKWMITPSITLGSFGNVLYWDALAHDPSFADGYRILVSKTDTQLSSFTDTLYYVFSEEADQWHTRSANLSLIGLDNETVHIAFINETPNGFKLYIDNIRVEQEDPVGIEVNNLASINIFPNPTQSTIHISGVENIEKIYILSLDGKKLIETNEKELNVNDLLPGKYFVEVKTNNTIIRSSFIKN